MSSNKQEGFFDKAWVEQQKKTFTEWCNNHLKKIGIQIQNFEKDFMDGQNLIKLLEILSNQRLPRPDKKGMRIHKIVNVDIALKFIASKGVNVGSIAAEEIVDGNVKMTLGMIWTIILRFAIQDIVIEEKSSKEGLLLWCQRKTDGYRGVDVQNFHTSFKDGMAFGALIHRHRPDLIDLGDYNILNPRNNLNNAFQVAEQKLEIPKMLDIEYLLKPGKVDELSVMTYVSMFYHRFTSDDKAVKATETIHLVLKNNRECQYMMESYQNLSSDLLEWISMTIEWLNMRPSITLLENSYKIFEKYNKYGITDKPQHYKEWIELENLYYTLQMRFKLSGRASFIPEEGRLISDIERGWVKLDVAEKDFEDWIFPLIELLTFYRRFLEKFYRRCQSVEDWLNEKMSELPKINYETLKLGDIKPMLNTSVIVKAVLSLENDKNDYLRDISEMVEFLRNKNYYDMQSINEREQQVIQQHSSVYQKCLKITEYLENAYSVLVKADKLLLDYAVRVSTFKKWLDSVNESFEDTHIANDEEEANEKLRSHYEFEKTLPAAQETLEEFKDLVLRIRKYAEEADIPQLVETVYSGISIESIIHTWNKMIKTSTKRLHELKEDVKMQKNMQNIKDEFKKSSMETNDWIKNMTTKINQLQLLDPDKLELDFLAKCEKEVVEFEPQLNNVEQIYQKIVDAKIFDTRNIGHSVQKLKMDYGKLRSYISSYYQEIEKQRQTSTQISQENINEYKNSFAHFDRDDDRRLNCDEFKSCLISLGYDSAIVENDEAFDELWRQLDKRDKGYITFEVFLQYMIELNEYHQTNENLTNCFCVLANGKPYITKQILIDNLGDEEAKYCIKNMKPYEYPTPEPESLDYSDFLENTLKSNNYV